MTRARALSPDRVFRQLVENDYTIGPNGKIHCPHHTDESPSYHVYPDHGYCFACGAYDDAVSWLVHQYNLSTSQALRQLTRFRYAPLLKCRQPQARKRHCFRPVKAPQWYAHLAKAEQLAQIPSALQDRGFTLADLQQLKVAAYGQDAVFPIFGPLGEVLALKRRHARPKPQRYSYMSPGHGTPAWCSSPLFASNTLLIIEGELNGMVISRVNRNLSVMGVAGTGGSLHLELLKGRTVYVYADGDKAGQKAQHTWARSAFSSGASEVFLLGPWHLDACDLAGSYSRAALREHLTSSLESAKPFNPLTQAPSFSAAATASNDSPPLAPKPDLMQSNLYSKPPALGGKPCL